MPKISDVEDVLEKLDQVFDDAPWLKECDLVLSGAERHVLNFRELWTLYWYASMGMRREEP